MRMKASGGGRTPVPAPPLFAGAVIGLTILSMASTAMALGAGLALGGATIPGPSSHGS